MDHPAHLRPVSQAGRSLGILCVAGVTVGALVLSLGTLISRAAYPAGRPELETAQSDHDEPVPSIAPETLRFPIELLDRSPSRAGRKKQSPSGAALESSPAPRLPAGIGATPARAERLRRVGQDPMIAAAMPPLDPSLTAPPGEDGKYTLHVISYELPQQARDFVAHLRARGHRAFITLGEHPERGPSWRVRIGPFSSRHEAQKYRRSFETREDMNTFVVARKRPQT